MDHSVLNALFLDIIAEPNPILISGKIGVLLIIAIPVVSIAAVIAILFGRSKGKDDES